MKDFKFLKFLDKISFLYEKFGVNYKVMRKILQLKLTMDERRVPTVMTSNKPKKEGNNFSKSLLVYGIIGIFTSVMMFFPFPLFLKMSIVFGMIIFMVMTTMISDFSSVLLDVKDKNILLPKPIDSRTINAAKATHIFIYMSTITMVIAGPSLLVGLYKYGFLFFLVFFIELIFIAAFVIFFTSLLYFFILLFFDGEKLKDIINYFQIVLSIVMMVVYQFIGRIFDVVNTNITFTPKWWHYLFAPVWFSAPLNLIVEKKAESYLIYHSICSVAIPLIVFVIYFKIVMPYFEKSLQKLNNNGKRKNKVVEKKSKTHRRLVNILCRKPLENIFFKFTQNMVSNERTLKLKLYPNLALAAIMPVIFMAGSFRKSKTFSQSLSEISTGKYHLFIYAAVAILTSSILMINYSERYKAAWIYKALPIEDTASIYKGALKGFVFKFILPIFLFDSIIFLAICRTRIIPDLILMLLNMFLLIIITFKFSDKQLPFSNDFQYTQGNNISIGILTFIYVGVSGGLQAGFAHNTYFYIGYSLILILLNIVLWKTSFKVPKNK